MDNLVVPVILVLTLGVVWLVLAVEKGTTNNVPDNLFWLAFGVALVILAWTLVHLLSPFPLTDDGAYLGFSIGWAVVGVITTAAFGAFARWRLSTESSASRGAQLLAGAAAVLLSCVVVSLGFLAIDVSFKERAFPAAAVYTDRDDCAEVAPAERQDPGCPLAGFYVGESDKWFFIVEDDDASTPTIDAADPNLPGRVLFVPRDNVRQLRLDECLKDPADTSTKPLHPSKRCPSDGHDQPAFEAP